MMDAKWRGFLRMALRKIYFRYPSRFEALKRNEIATPAMKKDGTPKMRMGKAMMTRRYSCEKCNKEGLKSTEVAVNHLFNIGPSPESRNSIPEWTWNDVIERMFCESDELERICHECHKELTTSEKESMRNGSFFDNIKLEDSRYAKRREGKWKW